MKIVRAKNNKNRLQVFDNRPFVINVELMRSGFKVDFMDLDSGEQRFAIYKNREVFDEEWELCYGVKNREDVSYNIINYYQE